MRRICLLTMLVLSPALASAEDFIPLTGPEIAAALTDVTLTYEGGEVQTFFASGRTLYNSGHDSWGTWAVRGDEYCSQWPPADGWACYAMDRAGEVLRFIGESGNITAGTVTE